MEEIELPSLAYMKTLSCSCACHSFPTKPTEHSGCCHYEISANILRAVTKCLQKGIYEPEKIIKELRYGLVTINQTLAYVNELKKTWKKELGIDDTGRQAGT